MVTTVYPKEQINWSTIVAKAVTSKFQIFTFKNTIISTTGQKSGQNGNQSSPFLIPHTTLHI